METTNSTSPNETYFESTKLVNQWYSDVANAMTELYKKQLNLTTGFYSNLFGALGGNNHIWNPMKNFSELFNYDAMKAKATPFNAPATTNLFYPFDKTMQQLNDYNRNLIYGFAKKMESGNFDWSSFNEKFQQTLEKEFEASQKLVNALMDSYNKRLETSFEINKNLQKEFNEQISEITKLNREFITETLNTFKTQAQTQTQTQAQTQTESEKFSKNGNSHEHETKKPSKVSVHN